MWVFRRVCRRDLALRREVWADHADLERHSVNGHCSPEDAPAGKGRGPGPTLGNSSTKGEPAGPLGWEEVWVLGAGGSR